MNVFTWCVNGCVPIIISIKVGDTLPWYLHRYMTGEKNIGTPKIGNILLAELIINFHKYYNN